jgi:hypothetical protein
MKNSLVKRQVIKAQSKKHRKAKQEKIAKTHQIWG